MGIDLDAVQNEDASISGIAPVATAPGILLKPSFPKTAFGGTDSEEHGLADRAQASETEFELRELLGL